MLHLSNNIKLIRQVLGETQEKFGKRFSVTVPMIKSYEGGKASPDEVFITRVSEYTGVEEKDLLNRKLKESDLPKLKVEKEYIVEEPKAVFKPNTTVPDRSIYKMAESNLVLSEAHKALADAHYLLAKNNENLISLVIGSVGIGKSKADPPIPIAVLELLAEEATENNYKSKEEALAAFRRIAHGGLKKKKEAGIRQSSGK